MRILVEAEVTGYHKKYKGTTQTYFIIKPCECVCARELLRRVALAKKESSNHCGVKRCFWSLIKSMWTRRNTWRQREQSLFGLFVKIFPPSSMQRAVRGLALFNGCLHAYKSPSSIFWVMCAVSSSKIRAVCAYGSFLYSFCILSGVSSSSITHIGLLQPSTTRFPVWVEPLYGRSTPWFFTRLRQLSHNPVQWLFPFTDIIFVRESTPVFRRCSHQEKHIFYSVCAQPVYGVMHLGFLRRKRVNNKASLFCVFMNKRE